MKQILVYDDRMGYEKTAWACPECGKITVMTHAPYICHWCGYVRSIGRAAKRPSGWQYNQKKKGGVINGRKKTTKPK